MRLDPEWRGRISDDAALWRDFEAICDCGGRLCGSESERAAVALVARFAQDAAPSISVHFDPVPYSGWTSPRAELWIGSDGEADCYPLLHSPPTPQSGLTAQVVDVGRGTPDDFEAHSAELPGCIALVRHELMFAAGTVHRSRKYQMARERGAVGFLIAGPLDGAIVAGSSGRTGADGIPALGISPQTAERLDGSRQGHATATLIVETREAPAVAENLRLDIPGKNDEWVVLSAHVDGHEISESAMDNASGIAAVLAVMRCLAPEVPRFARGLRVMFFNVEEWALTGSAHYVDGLTQAERDRIASNINLDSVAGSPNLTALTSGFPELGHYLRAVAGANGVDLKCHLPMMMNSDHANFAGAGIPAFRLVAGFDEPDANLRHVLTPADTRDKVSRDELLQAALLTAAIVAASCTASPDVVAGWRSRDTE